MEGPGVTIHRNNKNNARLQKAAAKAYDLVEDYAEQDPRSKDPTNPWNNPNEMHRKLDQVRIELLQAWQELKSIKQDNTTTTTTQQDPEERIMDPEEFRALYIDMITDAFADALESMRQQNSNKNDNDDDDGIDVDILVDCLQSGMELLDSSERDGFFFQSLEEEDDLDDNVGMDEMSIHELRRQELGY